MNVALYIGLESDEDSSSNTVCPKGEGGGKSAAFELRGKDLTVPEVSVLRVQRAAPGGDVCLVCV